MGQILILGAKGMLGGALKRVLPDAVAWDREDCDVADEAVLRQRVTALAPEAIINCVAYNDVDGAESKKEAAFLLNAQVPERLAALSRQLGATLVHFSSNYVFDGRLGEYDEAAQPMPLSVYAQSKYQGEQAIQRQGGNYYLVRTAVLFGPKGASELSKRSFVDLMLDLAASQPAIKAVSDEVNSLTYAVDLAAQVRLLLAQRPAAGIYHVTNAGAASWFEFAREIFRIRGFKTEVLPVPAASFPRAARRPAKAVLRNTKLPALRSWQEALKEFLTTNL